MGRLLVYSGLCLIAICALFGSCEAKPEIRGVALPPGYATISFIQGDVSLNGEKARLGQILEAKAKISTGINSSCEIVFEDRNIIRVNAATVAIFDLGPASKTIDLESGILAQVLKNLKKVKGSDAFQIRTPTAIASVRGTSFCVQASANWTYLCACNGTLSVSDRSGSNGTILSSPHHSALRYSRVDGEIKVAKAGLEYHDDESVQALATKIGYLIDWAKIDD